MKIWLLCPSLKRHILITVLLKAWNMVLKLNNLFYSKFPAVVVKPKTSPPSLGPPLPSPSSAVSQPTCIYHLPPLCSKSIWEGILHTSNGEVTCSASWRKQVYGVFPPTVLDHQSNSFISPYRSSPAQVTWLVPGKTQMSMGFQPSHHQRIMPCPSWVREGCLTQGLRT